MGSGASKGRAGAPPLASESEGGARRSPTAEVESILLAMVGVEDAEKIANIRRRVVELWPEELHDAWPAALSLAWQAIAEVALERPLTRAQTSALLRPLAAGAGLPPAAVSSALFLGALREPALQATPVRAAAEAVGRLLAGFLPTREVSIWAWSAEEPLRALACVGPSTPSRAAREAARQTISGEGADDGASGSAGLYGVLVLRRDGTGGAVVIRARAEDEPRVLAHGRAAAAALGPILERDFVVERAAKTERLLTEIAERQLRHVGLDLHDGPLQDTAQLAAEIHLLRAQVGEMGLPAETQRLLRGRLDDLAARLGAADEGLRRLAESFVLPVAVGKTIAEALKEEVDSFRERSGIRTVLRMQGDVDSIEPPQRSGLFRILQEALANARRHSEATNVRVGIRVEVEAARLEIVDDGVGFDVVETLAEAKDRRRLGLIGMSERARLLGGSLGIDSRQGGPTKLTVILPRLSPFR